MNQSTINASGLIEPFTKAPGFANNHPARAINARPNLKQWPKLQDGSSVE